LDYLTRGVAKAMFFPYKVKRSHVYISNRIKKHNHQWVSAMSKKISEYIVDETILQVGSKYILALDSNRA
jgi:hypothetical protein